MFSIYSSGLAPRLEAQINAPTLAPDQAARFVTALMKGAARSAINDEYIWSRYRTQEGQRYFSDSDKRQFWLKASNAFKQEVVHCAGSAIYEQIHALAGANPNVLKGINMVTEDAARQAVREALDSEIALYEAGDVPKPPEPPPAVTPGSPEAMSAAATLPVLERAVTMDLHKALSPDDRPNIEHFVPNDPTALEMYRRFGTVPKGYVDREQIKLMSPAYAEDMAKSGIPMLQELYFKRDVAERVAADMKHNSDKWIDFLRTFAPVNDVALQKGHNPQDVSMLDRLGGESTVRQAPILALQALAACYSETDLNKAHEIVSTFSSDPAAVMAAIHFDDLGAVPDAESAEEPTEEPADEPVKKGYEELADQADALLKGREGLVLRVDKSGKKRWMRTGDVSTDLASAKAKHSRYQKKIDAINSELKVLQKKKKPTEDEQDRIDELMEDRLDMLDAQDLVATKIQALSEQAGNSGKNPPVPKGVKSYGKLQAQAKTPYKRKGQTLEEQADALLKAAGVKVPGDED